MLLENGLLKRKKNKKQKHNRTEQKQKKERKKSKVWAIPSSYFYNKYVISCSNGYIYHFLDYIKLLLFVNANVIHHV